MIKEIFSELCTPIFRVKSAVYGGYYVTLSGTEDRVNGVVIRAGGPMGGTALKVEATQVYTSNRYFG